MGRLSLVLTAKRVWEIMDFRIPCWSWMVFWYSTVGSSGNSSGSMPWMLKELMPHSMCTVRLSVEMVTMSSGSLRMMSPKSRASSTREPVEVIWAGTLVRMPVSRL